MKKVIIACVGFFYLSAYAQPTPSTQLLIYPRAGVNSILTQIQQAHDQIDLVMYGFTDQRIESALIKAHQRGVLVRLMLQQKPYKAEGENTKAARRARQAGLQVKWTHPAFKITHQKTMIIDHRLAMIMTFNFTYSTFKTARNFALITQSPIEVNEIESVFNADWQRKTVSVKVPSLVWSPDNAQKKLIHFINDAKKYVFVYNQEVISYPINNALVKAAKRGVDVRLIVPASTAGQYQRVLRYLNRHGVQVRIDQQHYIHAKAMLESTQSGTARLFVGSSNFSDYGLNRNRELGIITSDLIPTRKMSSIFMKDWKTSEPPP